MMKNGLTLQAFRKQICTRRTIPFLFFLLSGFCLSENFCSGAEILEAEDAEISDTCRLFQDGSFSGGIGIVRGPESLPLDTESPPESHPDLVFSFEVPEPGFYEFRTYTGRAEEGDSSQLTGWFSLGEDAPKKKIFVKDPIEDGPEKEYIGKADLPEGKVKINLWIPKGAVFDRIKIDPYFPESVPEKAQYYLPPFVPPSAHPRVWITPELLPVIRERLSREPNASVWKRVCERGRLSSDAEIRESSDELAADKAFIYLITEDRNLGREAVGLMRDSLDTADFVNMQDVTRQIGRLIYNAALVYDWCYPLMTEEERRFFHDRSLFFAGEMEVRWPPFAQPITNTHGNERQINQDLFAMAIACYELDPLPYQYITYRIFEELVPMRQFQFRSPRHDQGTSYASHRYKDELAAALLFQRMCGVDIFDSGSKEIKNYYLYLRLPGGGMLRDGDGTGNGPFFDKHRMTFLLLNFYSGDPIVRGEWERLGSRLESPGEELLFLLFNDPDAPSLPSTEGLPPAWDSGPVLSSQILRTGWDLSSDSDDTVVEFKGGCFRFGNHQHADAGSFQIFRHGYLNADLGDYGDYGDRYDYGFAKRSVSHSVLLVYDPDEVFEGSPINDGGQRFFERSPWNAEEAQNDPTFRTGRLIASEILPNKENPSESFFCVDLTEAYSEKVKYYQRSMIWLKTNDPDVPVVLVVFDQVDISNDSFQVDWQLNTLTEPVKIDERTFSVLSVPPPVQNGEGNSKRSSMSVTTLLPKLGEFQRISLGGDDSVLVDGVRLKSPKDRPEAYGWRNLIRSADGKNRRVFLHVLQVGDETKSFKPVDFTETETGYSIGAAGRHLELSADGREVRFDEKGDM